MNKKNGPNVKNRDPTVKPMFKNVFSRFCILLGAIWRYNPQYNPQHKCSKMRGGGVKGRLNNVKKNRRFGTGEGPLVKFGLWSSESLLQLFWKLPLPLLCSGGCCSLVSSVWERKFHNNSWCYFDKLKVLKNSVVYSAASQGSWKHSWHLFHSYEGSLGNAKEFFKISRRSKNTV